MTQTPGPDAEPRRLAELALASGDPTAWFEPLYAAAEAGHAVVPWAGGKPSPELVTWAETAKHSPGRGAMVVGCGFGDDAEFVSALGYRTSGFDVSPSAIKAAKQLHPSSAVDYSAADLFALPENWRHRFDLVVEIMTVQALPRDVRAEAVESVAGLVAEGGTLVIGAVAEEGIDEPWDGPPWPLTREDVESFTEHGLRLSTLDRVRDGARWWAEFRRP
ncbi:class I SAM-dependent methyltransferase [Amycolatopsis sp. lyj-112]|uniref:class I SAM-dependent methyltransferase n=1 Tax=Amycolatopsis sp. lyj-112 TaxID=2789288 RepID=UPI003978653E